MEAWGLSDTGNVRKQNQDYYRIEQLTGGALLAVVCDGMGGVNGGRIAARIATDTMQQYFARHMKALQPGMEKTFIMRGFDITRRLRWPIARCLSIRSSARNFPAWARRSSRC